MSIEVGAKLPGKVTGITNFGAFIDLGSGKSGLVHISEVSNQYVNDIHDVLTVGDEVEVKVTAIGNDGKIGLSIRKAVDQPKGDFKRESRPRQEYKKPVDGAHKRQPRNDFRQAATASANPGKKQDFDALMSSFLKDSDDRLTSLKRNTEGKRGGRGGRRN